MRNHQRSFVQRYKGELGDNDKQDDGLPIRAVEVGDKYNVLAGKNQYPSGKH